MRHASILVVMLIACGTYGEDGSPAPSPPVEPPGPTGPTPADEPRADAIKIAPAGRDFAEGTEDAPVATFAHAIVLAQQKGTDVVACAGDYVENVVVDRAVRIFGNRSCADWKSSTARARIAPESGTPLVIRASDVRIVGVDVLASVPHFFPGTAAVGVFVANAERVTLRQMNVKSGNGTNGIDAAPAATNRLADPASGSNAVGAIGGVGEKCTCVDMTSSRGGNGANGDASSQPTDGSADPSSGFPSNKGASGPSTCAPGAAGANGPAASANDPPLVAFTVAAEGLTTTFALAAPNGRPGQGGGGGGALTTTSTGGAAGGCGGCGGSGGRGGGGGGSSIAVLSFQSGVTIESSELSSSDGARGGAGSDGLAGDLGANGGAGACNGGVGGSGGAGAGGNGGAGGTSAAVLYVGTRPSLIDTRAVFGRGGSGGAAGKGVAPDGAAGKPGAQGVTGEVITD